MLSPVIVENHTLTSAQYPALASEQARLAVQTFAKAAGLTNREAAAVIAQSYGLRVSFS
jgi:hypothetical protein